MLSRLSLRLPTYMRRPSTPSVISVPKASALVRTQASAPWANARLQYVMPISHIHCAWEDVQGGEMGLSYLDGLKWSYKNQYGHRIPSSFVQHKVFSSDNSIHLTMNFVRKHFLAISLCLSIHAVSSTVIPRSDDEVIPRIESVLNPGISLSVKEVGISSRS